MILLFPTLRTPRLRSSSWRWRVTISVTLVNSHLETSARMLFNLLKKLIKLPLLRQKPLRPPTPSVLVSLLTTQFSITRFRTLQTLHANLRKQHSITLLQSSTVLKRTSIVTLLPSCSCSVITWLYGQAILPMLQRRTTIECYSVF